MKTFAVALLALLALAQGQSICDTYTAENTTNLDLVSFVVGAVVGSVLEPGNPLAEYFNGTTPTGSIDYTNEANAAEAAALVNNLITYFGQALGCSDDSIGPYNGTDMTVAHANIPIGHVAFVTFNQAVLGVLGGAGVQESDLTAVNGVLESLRPQICNQADCATICNRYSGLLGITNSDLVSGLVLTVFGELTTSTNPLFGFFNGTIPEGSIDYTDPANEQAVAALANGLITFFSDALGCSDGTIAPYTGGTMAAVHAGIPIDNFAFTTFNGIIATVATAAGVDPADVATVGGVLESLRGEICNQADCVAATTETSATATTATTTTATTEDNAGAIVAPMAALLAVALAF